MSAEAFDIVVFGGGKAGKSLAMDQARAGKRVAMIERGYIGGSCINVACIPSKALIRSAEIHASALQAEAFGTATTSTLDMNAVAARTAKVVGDMVGLNRKAFEASGLELILGSGRFVEPRVIEVSTTEGTRRLTAPEIYLNLGTSAHMPAIPGLTESQPLTHVEALALTELPEHLIILGGGYIGLELGQAFRRLGARVTIVERGSNIAKQEDDDVAHALRDALVEEGLSFVFDARVERVSGRSGQGVEVILDGGAAVFGSHLLVATGRTPQTKGIGLDIAGVAVDQGGFITVDASLRTSAAEIWALGEIAGTPMFTHASFDDYRVIKSVKSGGPHRASRRTIPYCVFIDPELARIGLNEKQATEAGITFRVARLPMASVPRARTLGATRGFMKALIGKDDRILGFTMMGVQAGEVMTSVQIAMIAGLPYQTLRDAIIAHPTIAEGLNLLFASVPETKQAG
ncbi:mercuric reductase [Asaia sp. W19]|uniref:FAD-dependent oxidoreductase n=1 Tax=Asaia sp. W19 TaxID=2067395 RepID=UPI000F8DBD5F|nr:FAD-dependent oxidoreductase [Asaia sp. W19]RUT24456.1 mercuric reductase [Asaia sp. W19]